MAAEQSKVVVYAALGGNTAIAVVKFTAAVLTGSTAMLTEGVHSLVDSLDQVMLLVGQARAAKPPDRSHPFGYGLEIYFWSFTVALMVFMLGGAFSAYEGWTKLSHPAAADRPWVNYLVLGVSAVFEGSSFLLGVREYRRFTGGRVGLLRFLKVSKDPSLIVTLMEDGAALVGLALAAMGVAGQAVLHLPWADGAASIGIGVLLMGVAVALANETRSLIAGEAATPRVVEAVRDAVDRHPAVRGAPEVATLHLGPENILVCVTLDLDDGPELRAVTREITGAVREADPRIFRVYFRPLSASEADPDHARAAEPHGAPVADVASGAAPRA